VGELRRCRFHATGDVLGLCAAESRAATAIFVGSLQRTAGSFALSLTRTILPLDVEKAFTSKSPQLPEHLDTGRADR
jgi:hypothetical protein